MSEEKKKIISDMRARYNANGNAIIPNTFQHPNVFIDRLMYYLDPEENVVLTFAVRRILGFQSNIMSRKDNISLSQFTDGLTAEDGHMLCLGTGLGVNTVRRCLEALAYYKILIPLEKPNPVKGQEYWLQEKEENIDWEGLLNRKEERKVFYKKKTMKATKNSLISRGYVARKGNVARKAPVTSHVTKGVTSHVNTKPTETHRNPPITYIDFQNMTVIEARKVPTLKMYAKATDFFPGSVIWESVHKCILENNLTYDQIHDAAVAWAGRGFKPENVVGILEWAIHGIPNFKPVTYQNKTTTQSKQAQNTAALQSMQFDEEGNLLNVKS